MLTKDKIIKWCAKNNARINARNDVSEVNFSGDGASRNIAGAARPGRRGPDLIDYDAYLKNVSVFRVTKNGITEEYTREDLESWVEETDEFMDQIRKLEDIILDLDRLRNNVSDYVLLDANDSSVKNIKNSFESTLEEFPNLQIDPSEYQMKPDDLISGGMGLQEKIQKAQEKIERRYIKEIANRVGVSAGFKVTDEDMAEEFDTHSCLVRLRKGNKDVIARIAHVWTSDRLANQIKVAINEGAASLQQQLSQKK